MHKASPGPIPSHSVSVLYCRKLWAVSRTSFKNKLLPEESSIAVCFCPEALVMDEPIAGGRMLESAL